MVREGLAAVPANGDAAHDHDGDEGERTSAPAEGNGEWQAVAALTNDAYSRVATSRLEDLVNLVGELAISHAMIARTVDDARLSDLHLPVGRHARTLRQLQVLVLGMRILWGVFTQAPGPAFNRLLALAALQLILFAALFHVAATWSHSG